MMVEMEMPTGAFAMCVGQDSLDLRGEESMKYVARRTPDPKLDIEGWFGPACSMDRIATGHA